MPPCSRGGAASRSPVEVASRPGGAAASRSHRPPDASDSVPTTLRATPARASAAARWGLVAPASTQSSATADRAASVATSTGSPASASRSATYRLLVRATAHSARATETGSHPSTSGLRSGAYSARCPRRACTTTPPLRSRTGTIRIVHLSSRDEGLTTGDRTRRRRRQHQGGGGARRRTGPDRLRAIRGVARAGGPGRRDRLRRRPTRARRVSPSH